MRTERRRDTLMRRWCQKVRLPTEWHNEACWEWIGTKGRTGYGQVHGGNGKRGLLAAHRVAYEAFVGPIPRGLVIDHLCRNRGCVNPEHLEPVTQRVNIRRGNAPPGIAARKEFCVNGHPLTGDNLRVARVSGGRTKRTCWICRWICRRAVRRASRAKAKAFLCGPAPKEGG